ncbi:MAG: hypothetical protein E7419_01565 [Ruminococcaceae bacterium]|nr:hypothetical protein [Oscillospiraceae bacterium]
MKRIITVLITIIVFMTTTVFADVNIPKEFMAYPQNYTASYSLSMQIDDNTDIRALFDEIFTTDDAISNAIGTDFMSFLSAMFEYDGNIYLQADMSKDFKKIKLSMTNSTKFSSVVSTNLNYTVNSNVGIWMDMDFSDETKPKLDLILQSPTSDKYYSINVGNYITKEDIDSFLNVFNAEYIKKFYEDLAVAFYENATVNKTNYGCKISMDNEGFVRYLDEVVTRISDEQITEDEEISFSFKDMNFLGKDGIQADYRFKNGYIYFSQVSADIMLDISSITKAIGEEWPYKSSGKINIKINEKIDYTKIDKTVVEYPYINDGNSISLNNLFEDEMNSNEYEDYEFEYPYWTASAYCTTLPVIDGQYYVPLRAILEDGYAESVLIDYNNDVITATSEYFDGFNTLTMTIGSDKVYLDSVEHTIGKVILIDDVTYVNSRLFTDVFGWQLTDITHELISDTYSVTFYTE